MGSGQGVRAMPQAAVDLPVLLWCAQSQLLTRCDITVTPRYGQALVTLHVVCQTPTHPEFSKELHIRNHQ